MQGDRQHNWCCTKSQQQPSEEAQDGLSLSLKFVWPIIRENHLSCAAQCWSKRSAPTEEGQKLHSGYFIFSFKENFQLLELPEQVCFSKIRQQSHYLIRWQRIQSKNEELGAGEFFYYNSQTKKKKTVFCTRGAFDPFSIYSCCVR